MKKILLILIAAIFFILSSCSDNTYIFENNYANSQDHVFFVSNDIVYMQTYPNLISTHYYSKALDKLIPIDPDPTNIIISDESICAQMVPYIIEDDVIYGRDFAKISDFRNIRTYSLISYNFGTNQRKHIYTSYDAITSCIKAGDYLFFSEQGIFDKITRINLKNSRADKIDFDILSGRKYTAYRDKIYYIKDDGKLYFNDIDFQNETLYIDDKANDFIITDEFIAYVFKDYVNGTDSILKVLDGTNKKLIFSLSDVSKFYIDKNYLYYYLSDEKKIYKKEINDSSESTIIFDIEKDTILKEKNNFLSDFVVNSGIVFMNIKKDGSNYLFAKFDIETSEKITVLSSREEFE